MGDKERGGREHPRLLVHNFLSPEECKELEFIHKSCSTVGYRPNVFSTTLSHLIATHSPHLILPFLHIRDRLKDQIEDFFACQYELVVEFTALISWCKGASIGWHTDDNRPYLKQRHFAAVCYLNSYAKEFSGGLFHFQDGDQPATVTPLAGDALIYTADSRNVHSVDEVVDGERLTLTLWFSRDSCYDEDAKLISLLSQIHTNTSCVPLPASSNMYWYSPDNQELGFDIRLGRIHVLGYDIYCAQVSSDVSELLLKPLQLAKGGELFPQEFENIMHALQAVQFFHWKHSGPRGTRENGKAVKQVQSHLTKIQVEDPQLVQIVFGLVDIEHSADWENFAAAIKAWEEYTSKLVEKMLVSLPHWKSHKAMFSVSEDGVFGDTSI